MQMEEASLPMRMFAVGEEPKGIRVAAYHKSRAISRVLNALAEEEVEYLRQSSFGKFIGIAEKPRFSGRFARFLMSRQLKVNKPHEIWFLYAGRPIRFSLREFAIVTGLPCGKFPKKSKKNLKKIISETSNWSTLFGMLPSISVKSVINLLKKKMVTDKVVRIKYACLALLASVLLTTTHNPKIDPVHAEAIKDLDEFFAYPWGRLSFDMMMSSIKERDEVSLSQNTIAIKGFVHAIQLVMLEVVPAITEVVGSCESSSESDEDTEKEGQSSNVSLNPAHARDVHVAAEVEVDCIIADDGEAELDEATLCWSDDEEDDKVSNMLALIKTDYSFNNSMFTGGVTKLDVDRMREEASKKKLAEANKKKQEAGSSKSNVGDNLQSEFPVFPDGQLQMLADMVASQVKDDMKVMFDQVSKGFEMIGETKAAIEVFESNLIRGMDQKLKSMEVALMAKLSRKDTPQVNQTSKVDEPDPFGHGCGRKTNSGGSSQSIQLQDYSTVGEGFVGTLIDSVVQDINANHNVEKLVTEVQRKVVSEVVGGQTTAEKELVVECTGTEQGEAGGGKLVVSCSNNEQVQGYSVRGECDALLEKERGDLNLNKQSIGSEVVPRGDNEGDEVVDEMEIDGCGETEEVDDGDNFRKSKRIKTVPKSLVDEYQCDKRLVRLARGSPVVLFGSDPNTNYTDKYVKLQSKLLSNGNFGVQNGTFITHQELAEIAIRKHVLSPKLMDVLMWHTQAAWSHQYSSYTPGRTLFLDTKFVSLLSKNYTKFLRIGKKEFHRFQKTLLAYFTGDKTSNKCIDRVYCPFNFDQQHWVGVFIDCNNWSIQVLDCNTTMRSDLTLKKELVTFASMFPYALKQACGKLTLKEPKPCSVERVKGIIPNTILSDSGVTAVLLMQAHAIAGVDGCACIKPESIALESQKLAVMIYEDNCDSL